MKTNTHQLAFTASVVTPAFSRILKNTASVWVARFINGSSAPETVCYHPLFGEIVKGSGLVHREMGCYYSRRQKAWFWLLREYNEANNTMVFELESSMTVAFAHWAAMEVKNSGRLLPCGTIPML